MVTLPVQGAIPDEAIGEEIGAVRRLDVSADWTTLFFRLNEQSFTADDDGITLRQLGIIDGTALLCCA